MGRVAVFEIGPAGAADQQCIAGEHPVVHQEAIGIGGVPRRVDDIEPDTLDGDAIAVGDAHRHHVDAAFLAHHRDAFGAVAERPEAGDVIGVQMGIQRLHQPEVELVEELDVTLHLVEHGIDDQRLAAAPGGDEIGVATGGAVEQLAENHRFPPGAGTLPLAAIIARVGAPRPAFF